MVLKRSKADKIQAMCRNFEEKGGCKRGNCHFDHGVIDSARFERLVRWGTEGISRNCEYLSVECTVTNGVPDWRITLKPDAFGKMKSSEPMAKNIPDRPFGYSDRDLFRLLRIVEEVVGSTTSRSMVSHIQNGGECVARSEFTSPIHTDKELGICKSRAKKRVYVSGIRKELVHSFSSLALSWINYFFSLANTWALESDTSYIIR